MKARDLDLSKEQMIVLKKLCDKDGLNQNELAFLTLRDKSSLTRLLSKMEKKEYIFRMQSTEDKRNNHVFITLKGRDIFSKTRPVIKEIMEQMERDITKKEILQMINTLQKIQFNFTGKYTTSLTHNVWENLYYQFWGLY